MIDFEQLGAFYLGKRVDEQSAALTDDIVLYDAKDLTTHAVIIGMTGSGKTGLGIGLIEEAAIDHIPVIAIDPKGDLGNLLLTFPELSPSDFRPWVNARQATDQGRSVDDFAKDQAALWKKGLGEWGQDGARIARFRASADLAIYTPGSTAGLPLSALKSFAAPGAAVLGDGDLYRERILATATGILSLLGIDADPLASREHILISQLLDHAWRERRDLDIAGLIAAIQKPPIERIGVLDLESFFPGKDRFGLAMRVNNLLAAPGFDAWLEGDALSAQNLFYTQAGKPRVSVVSIAHLGDAERMFFVTMLLNEIIAWMRAQQGTGSLRAMLYMDEIFGFMPPTANPPSKQLLLTLLKQARAYGLGLVLATQNPVDLDYKGLSNAGTWFIGRLQTERDKARIMDGLEGANQGDFDRAATERRIAGLGKRRFLLHNVHEDEPVIFQTRFVMSYLAGPLTRDQIRALMDERRPDTPPGQGSPSPDVAGQAPVVPPAIRQVFLPSSGIVDVYYPRLLAAAGIGFRDTRRRIDEQRGSVYTVEARDAPVPIDWDESEKLPIAADRLCESGMEGAQFAACPTPLLEAGSYAAWERELRRWLRDNETVTLFQSRKYRMSSEPGESEGEFRARLQQRANEERDQAVARLRKRYATRATALENRLLRAQQSIEREQEQATHRKIDSAMSFGTAILGAVLGRKRISATTANRIGTAVRRAGAAQKKSGDVTRAKETADRVTEEIEALNAELEREIESLDLAFDAQAEELEEIVIRPKSTDLHVSLLALAWLPYRRSGDGRLLPAWD